MFFRCERSASEGFSSVLDHDDLDCNGYDHDDQEQSVVEETLEYVVLLGTQLTSVDLVEHLHEHECVEQDGIVVALWCWVSLYCDLSSGKVFNGIGSNWVEERICTSLACVVLQVEDVLTSEQYHQQNCGLVYSLSDDISPHGSSDDLFVSMIGRCIE